MESIIMPEPTTAIQKRTGERNAIAPLNLIRSETVLSRLPIHNLAKRGRVDIHITKKNEHGEVDLNWEVTYNEKYGQARQLAYKLDTVVINRRIDEQQRPLPRIIRLGTQRQICKELNFTTGKAATDIKKAILQNVGALITTKLKYKSNDGTERTLEAGFTRYSVVFTGERLPDGRKADGVFLVLNDIYLDILNNAPSRPLDYDYLKALPPAAQRFYEIVSYKIFSALNYKKPEAQLRYSDYCTFSAQHRYFDYNRVKKQMYKVHRPHIKSGYINKVTYEMSTDPEGREDWTMVYAIGDKAKIEHEISNGAQRLPFPQKESPREERDVTATPRETTTPNPTTTQARELIRFFFKLFHDTDATYFSPKSLLHAADLINKHGENHARHIIEFAHKTAPETNYHPQTFEGILHYTPLALADYEASERRKQEQENQREKEREERRKEQYMIFERDELDRIKSAMTPDELEEIRDQIRVELRAELIKNGVNPDNDFTLDTRIRLKLNQLITEKSTILTYDQWKEQGREAAQTPHSTPSP